MKDSLTTVNSGDFVQGLPKGYVTAYGTAIPWTELEAMNMGAGLMHSLFTQQRCSYWRLFSLLE
jgi:hypothetical protein